MACIHQQHDPKMVAILAREVVAELERLGVVTPQAPDLTSTPAGVPVATLIFDREGWSPELFKRLARRGIACITWHKNHTGDDWPVTDFNAHAVPLHGPVQVNTRYVDLAERPVALSNDLVVRQIRRLDNGRQMPLVTTHPTLPIAQVAGAPFSRWAQENYFKYTRREFNLDALSRHVIEPLPPDTAVVNPTVRKHRKTIRRLTGELQRHLLTADRQQDHNPTRRARINELHEQLNELRQQCRRLPAHVPVGELPADQRPEALPIAPRLFDDLIAMLCYRAESRLMHILHATANPSNATRQLLAALLRADANLVPDPVRRTLTVQIFGFANQANERTLLPLLEQLNAARTCYPGTNLQLVYELVSASVTNANQVTL